MVGTEWRKNYTFEEKLINNINMFTLFLYSMLGKTMYSNFEVVIKEIRIS